MLPIQPSASRTAKSFSQLNPTDESVGYCQSSAARTTFEQLMARKKSTVRVVRDDEENVEQVMVGDSSVEILDVDANVIAKCELSDLEAVTAEDFPQDLILEADSSDGFDTYLFNEIELGSSDG